VFFDVDPETVFVLPVAGSVKSAELVSLSGSASDDVGVAGVEVAVQDAVSLLWWDSVSGVFDAAAPVYAAASVALPGEVSTAWDVVFDFAGTGGSGSYVASARAVDTAGNVDLSDAVTDFTIGPVLSYAGDFAPPGQADLTPVDVTTNSTHLYVFDVARYRIARIDRATGMIDAETGGTRSTAEGLFAAARAIAIDSGGNIYVADTPNNRIAKYDADLNYLMKFGANGTGIGQFHQVYSLAVGTGRLADGTLGEVVYSVDGDGRITRWNPDGTVIGYFASAAALNQPRMAEVHPVTDDFWLVNARDREVVVFDVDGNELFRFGSGGTGPGQFRGDPRGITISADGTEIFVSDEGNHRVQVFDQTGNYLREIGGTTPGTADYLVDARGLEITDDGTLVVSDEWDHSMKEFDPTTGVLTRQLFGATAPVGGVNTPRGLAVDPLGRVFVSDWWNQRIQRWESDGSGAFAWGFRGTVDEPGSINFAWDVAVEPVTNRIFVANRESHEIEVFEADGTYVNRFGERGTGDGQLEFPHGVAFGPDGNLWVTDSKGDRLIRFSIDSAGHGTFVANYTNGLDLPTGVAVESNGMVWVADTLNGRYQRLDPTTMTWTVFTAPIGGTTAYRRPWGVSVAPDGTLWLADTNNHRIVNIDNQGNFIAAATGTEMGAGALMQPFDVEVLQYGDLVVSDTFSNRIIVVQVG
jgi:sugar lactone lactonase YvrE